MAPPKHWRRRDDDRDVDEGSMRPTWRTLVSVIVASGVLCGLAYRVGRWCENVETGAETRATMVAVQAEQADEKNQLADMKTAIYEIKTKVDEIAKRRDVAYQGPAKAGVAAEAP